MPIVPIQQGPSVQRQPLDTTPLRAVANGSPVASAIATGLEQIGAATAGYAKTLYGIQGQQAEADAKDGDNSFALAISKRMYGDGGLSTLKGRNAVDAFQPTMDGIEEDRRSIAQGLSPRARKLFDRVAVERSTDALSTASRHVAIEHGDVLDGADENRWKIAGSDAGNAFLDQQDSEKHIGTAVIALRQYGERHGWSDEETAGKTLALVSGIRKDVGQRLAGADPDLARKYVQIHGSQIMTDDQSAIMTTASAEQRRREAQAHQQQREQAADLGEQARDLIGMVGNGVSVEPLSAGKLADNLEALGRPILATQLRSSLKVQTFTTQAKTWRPDQLQGWLNDAYTKTRGGATPDQGAQIGAAEKLLGQMREGVKTDPLSWAARAGTANIAPLDISDPHSVGQRVTTALAVGDKYGTKPVFFTDEEAATLSGQIAKSNPDGKLRIAGQIAQNFGRYGRDVLGSLAGADPVFAHAAALATTGPAGHTTALRIFAGQEALKDKAVSPPSGDAFNAAGGVDGALRYTPKALGAVLQSAKAIYASRANGLDPKVVDTDIWSRSLNEAAGATYRQDGSHVGGFGSYRGAQIVLPTSVAPGDFGWLVAHVTDADLKASPPTYGNGKPASAADIHGGYLFDAGDGKYFVSLDRAGTQFLRGRNGNYVLDMNRLLPVLRARQPTTMWGTVKSSLGF